jgi:phospholipase D
MRKTIIQITILSLLILFSGCSNTQAVELTLNNTPVHVYFSPHGGATDAVVKEIDRARSEILVQAYSFTSKDIAKALVDAHNRLFLSLHSNHSVLPTSNHSAR